MTDAGPYVAQIVNEIPDDVLWGRDLVPYLSSRGVYPSLLDIAAERQRRRPTDSRRNRRRTYPEGEQP